MPLRCPLVLLLTLLVAPIYSAAYLKIQDIDGESQAAAHENWIDVVGWSYAATNPNPRGSVIAGPLVIDKFLDRSTPYLMQALHAGSTLPDAILEVTTDTGGVPIVYLRFTLTNVRVSAWEGSGRRSELPPESLSLTFEKIQINYWEIEDDHSRGAEHEFSWNLRTNSPD